MAKPSHKLSLRIQSMRRKLLWYDINAPWKPAKKTFVPDCLSRAPSKQVASTQELDVIVEADHNICQLFDSQEKLKEFRINTASDSGLQLLQRTVMQGWPVDRRKYLKSAMACFSRKSAGSIKSNASRNAVMHSRKS